MKSRKFILTLFAILAFIQLLAPAKMIYDKEQILKKGKAYNFLTRPLDPNDPFRGKYVDLRYKMNSFKTADSTWRNKHDVYVYLKDSLGFAKIDTISDKKLTLTNDYIVATKNWYRDYDSVLLFKLPFNRFYMEESKAKPAEDLVRNSQRDSSKVDLTYAKVYIKNGKYVLEDLFVNNIPIKDAINANK